MTQKEMGQILTYLETLFPNSFRGLSDDQRKMTLLIWQNEFAGYSAADVQAAIRAAIREKKANGFAPGFDEIQAQLRPTDKLALPGIDEYEAEVVAWLEEERRKADAHKLEKRGSTVSILQLGREDEDHL